MNELKPCPFCGSKANIVHNYIGQASVACTNTYYCIAANMAWWDYEEDAIDAWNRRAENDQR